MNRSTSKGLIFNKRAFGFCVITFVVLSLLFSAISFQQFEIFKDNQEKLSFKEANNIKNKLQEEIATSLSAVKIMAFFIDKNGEVNNFDSVAAAILLTHPNIDAIQLVPNGIIQYMYPLKGNESVIGYDVLSDTLRNKEIYKAINKKELFFAGPFQLKQGGVGIVGRLPIFRQNRFWGLTAVVIKMETLLKAVGIDNTGKSGYYYQLSKINPNTQKEEFFIKHENELSLSQYNTVKVPNGEWNLSVAPVDPWNGIKFIYLLASLGFILSLLSSIFIYRVINRPKKLEKLVQIRTKELELNREKYRSLIEQASDGIIITDLNGNIIEVNNSICLMSGYDKNELVGQQLSLMLPKEDEKLNPLRFEELLAGKSLLYERRMLKKDGSIIPVEVNSKMASQNSLIGFVRDITKRKEAQHAIEVSNERFELVAAATNDIIWDHDFVADKTWGSDKLFELYGLNSATDKITLERVLENIHSDEREKVIAGLNKAISDKSPSFSEEFRFKSANGEYMNIYDRAFIKYDKEGIPERIVGAMHDITERKKAAEEIKANGELLRELYNNSQNIREEERAYIAREIHDELGQQLTGLKMDIFWIKRKLNSEDPLMKEKIAGTIELLDQTIKTVRKISTELRPSILDDLGLIAAMEWQSEEFGKRAGLIVNFSCNLDESNLKPESKITVFRIYQEILTNIARHAEATIVNTSVNIKNNQLFLSVDDNGNGFDIDTLIHKNTLGIKGIKERAKQIGGTYEIKSMTGNGTSVLVSIPVF